MIEITNRQMTIADRFFRRQLDKDHLDEVLFSLEEDNDHIKIIRLGDLFFKYRLWVMNDEYTDYDPEIEGKQFGNCLCVEYKGKVVLQYISSNDFIDAEKWVKFLIEFPKAVVCKGCEGYFKGEKYEYCENCDPYVMEREDDCCICLSNEKSVWVKTKCGHIFHSACWANVLSEGQKRERKCPLCRTVVKFQEYDII